MNDGKINFFEKILIFSQQDTKFFQFFANSYKNCQNLKKNYLKGVELDQQKLVDLQTYFQQSSKTTKTQLSSQPYLKKSIKILAELTPRHKALRNLLMRLPIYA